MSLSFAFYSNIKNGDRASLRRHSWIFCFVPNGVIFFRKLLKTVCFDCEMTLCWQNLLKAVCFGHNCFFFGIAGKNSRFCQNSLTYWDSFMVIFRFLGQNSLNLELRAFAVHKILMEH